MSDLSFTKELETNPNAGVSQSEFDNTPLPPGEYSFVIEKAESAPCVGGIHSINPVKIAEYLTTNPDVVPGECLKIQAQITEGPFANRKLFWGKFEFMYLAASDETTQEGTSNGKKWKMTPDTKSSMGRSNVQGLLRRLNKGSIDSASELIGLSGIVSVGVKKDRNTYGFTVKSTDKQPKANVTGTIAHVSDDAPF